MSRGKLYEKSNATTPFSSSDCVILSLYPPRCLPLLVPLFRCVYEIYRVFSKNTTKSITRVSLEGCCENLVQPRPESAEILVYRRFCQIEIASGCQHPVTKEMSSGWMFMGETRIQFILLWRKEMVGSSIISNIAWLRHIT